MRRAHPTLLLLAVLGLLGTVAGAAEAEPVALPGGKASANGILVKLRPSKDRGARTERELADRQLAIGRRFHRVPRLLRLVPHPGRGPRSWSAPALRDKIDELRRSGEFEYVEPDWLVRTSQTPGDAALADGRLWGLDNRGQSGGVAGVDIAAPEAWAVTTGDPAVVVGVIDTGIRTSHQEFSGQMWTNPGEIAGNGIDDDANGYTDDIHGINAITGSGNPYDDNGHGSHCAGTIAARASGGGPHVGVAPGVRLMGLKFLDSSGSGYTSDAIECIEYAIRQRVDILSNSWGGSGFSLALEDAISDANEAGILFVAAAGNASSNNDRFPQYPSGYELPNVISVAAVDRSGQLAGFSNYGASSVHLAAPGVAIFSASADSDSSYESLNGTSMACPHVAGVAALLRSRFPGIGVPELRNRLLLTTRPLAALEGQVARPGIVSAPGALGATADGVLELQVPNDPVLRAGEPHDLRVTVSDLLPVTDAVVVASFDGGPELRLLDNGAPPDLRAGDGSYAGTLVAPAGVSSTLLRIRAEAPGKQAAESQSEIALVAPPANDHFANRLPLLPGSTQTTGSNLSASREAGEPVQPSAGGHSVWWEWTAPRSTSVTISTTGSDFDTTLAIYRGETLDNLRLVAANDDFIGLQSAATFAATAGARYQIQVDGYAGDQGAIQLHYPSPGTAEGPPVIIAHPVGRSVLLGEPFQITVAATGAAPLSYQWLLDGTEIPGATALTHSVSAATEDDEGPYAVRITNPAGSVTSNAAFVAVEPVALAPENDHFEHALELVGESGNYQGSNLSTGGEPGEPDHAGVAGPLASVWFTWVAPDDGTLEIDTLGSDFDTVLAAYTGSALDELQLLAANDDQGDGLHSEIRLEVSAGDRYHIAVDGYETEQGRITLSHRFRSEPGTTDNDDFGERLPLAPRVTARGSNLEAGGQVLEPDHSGTGATPASLWWSWIAPTDGRVTLHARGDGFSPVVAAYTGTSLAILEPVSPDEEPPSPTGLHFRAEAQVEYAIAIDSRDAGRGPFALNLDFLPDDEDGDERMAFDLFGEDFELAPDGISMWDRHGDWIRDGDQGGDEILEFSDGTRFASLGFHPPEGGAGFTRLRQPLEFRGERLVVEGWIRFTRSSNGLHDRYSLEFQDPDGIEFGRVDFHADPLGVTIASAADEDEKWWLEYDVWYRLRHELDLTANTLDLSSSGTGFARGLPLFTGEAPAGLGSIAFSWSYDAGSPGDGYLDLDDLRVAALVEGAGPARRLESEPNDSFATATRLTTSEFALSPHPDVAESDLLPRLTLVGGGDGTPDYFLLELPEPGGSLTLDLDHSSGVDAVVSVWDADGRLIDSNDDSSIGSGAGGSSLTRDPFLALPALPAGRYHIGLAAYPLSVDDGGFAPDTPPLPAGSLYELQLTTNAVPAAGSLVVSLDGQPLTSGGIVDFGPVAWNDRRGIDLRLRNAGGTALAGLEARAGGSFVSGPLEESLEAGGEASLRLEFAPGEGASAASESTLVLHQGGNLPDFTLRLRGESATALAWFDAAAAAAGLTGAAAATDATPYADGVPNLLKYAFGLPLGRPANRSSDALPSIRIVRPDGGPAAWELEFLRSTGLGLQYEPRISRGLSPDSFRPLPGGEEQSIEVIDARRERVRIRSAIDPASQPQGFFHIEVELR